MPPSKRSLFVPLIGLLLVGCSSTSSIIDEGDAERHPLPVVAGPAEMLDLSLTIFPTPRQAVYADTSIRLQDALRVDETHPAFLDVLDSLGLKATWIALPPEGYALSVSVDAGRPLIVVAAADEPGRRWAEQALDQLTAAGDDGDAYVRECTIVDAPAFALRGNKRPQAWELAYRANFAWGAGSGDAHAERTFVPFIAPGSPLDVTAPAVIDAIEKLSYWQQRGARRFCVKFDDVGFALTPATRLAYGTYPRALVVYLTAVIEGLQARDPDAQLCFLPQTYWWNDTRMTPYAAAIRRAGGLPPGVVLVMTGPEIVSETIDATGLQAARQAFGATRARALIYDNLGREGDWGPLTGRVAALVEEADGVFGERGTPVNRLTRLDWLWNPYAYDPERAWRRAIFELAGPDGYEALADACRAFREGAAPRRAARAVERFAETDLGQFEPAMPQTELVAALRADLNRLARTWQADPLTGAAR